MQQSTIKKFYIAAGVISAPSLIFLLVVFFEKVFISAVNEGFNAFVETVFPFALGLLFIALGILIAIVLLSLFQERQEVKKAALKAEEAAKLQKYVTKKTKK